MLKSLSALTAATVLGLAAVGISATSGEAKSNSSRFRCEAVGTGDTEISARYEERIKKKGPRAKFRVEFETTTADGFVAGQPVVFSVDTVAVGTVPLSGGSGDLEAELRLDTKAHGRGHKKPFPPTFPVVQAGSVVDAAVGGVVVLGCVLDSD
ncbi:MAG: hypothetical protein QOD94_2690 [Alphaproteobacteria bacterium]|jgi:hypothetical protein|nr:hypothetical protein [Alphaproteobacteria bacterium]